jgi:transcriptional regulator with XRE-family HTH domain
MDKITAFTKRNPGRIVALLGERVRRLRLAAGWTQVELAERAGVSVSTLKLFERTGRISLQRLAKIAVVLNVDGELGGLFEEPRMVASIDAVERMDRKRAPRRVKKGEQS